MMGIIWGMGFGGCIWIDSLVGWLEIDMVMTVCMGGIVCSIYNSWVSMALVHVSWFPVLLAEISSLGLSSGWVARGDRDDVGDRDDHDGVRIGSASPNPFMLALEPFTVGTWSPPFFRPTRDIARRSMLPDASSAIKNLASSPQSSQSPFCDASAINRTT